MIEAMGEPVNSRTIKQTIRTAKDAVTAESRFRLYATSNGRKEKRRPRRTKRGCESAPTLRFRVLA